MHLSPHNHKVKWKDSLTFLSCQNNFLLHFIKNFYQNLWNRFLFPAEPLLHDWIIFFHMILPYLLQWISSLTAFKVILYSPSYGATALHFLLKFRLLWSFYKDSSLVHFACDLESCPQISVRRWDTSLGFQSSASTSLSIWYKKSKIYTENIYLAKKLSLKLNLCSKF